MRERPLSPHLSIYKPQLTSFTSIMHRLTGLALYAGTAALVVWLWSAAYNAECFEGISEFLSGVIGKILLFVWTLAFYYHLGNGVRHLIWDTGRALSIPAAYRAGYIVLLFTVGATAVTWWLLVKNAGIAVPGVEL